MFTWLVNRPFEVVVHSLTSSVLDTHSVPVG